MKNIKKFGLGLIVAMLVLFGGFTSKANAAAINEATNVGVTPGTQFVTYQGVPVYRLRVSNTGNALDTITTLSPTPSGSANDTLVTLHFFNDANDNGFVDQGDTDLGASAAFASDNTIQTFDIADVPVAAGATASILITAQGNSAANNTLGFNLSFAAASAIAMSVTPFGIFPILNASTMTMTTTVPTVIAVDASNNPAPKTVSPGATNVSVKRLAISAVAGTSDSIVSIAPTPTGTANDNLDLTSVKFYIDSGSVPGEVDGTDIQLATTPAVYTGDDARTIFTFSSPVQVAAFSTVNILIVYNIGAGIAPASTLYTQVAAAGDVIAGSGTATSGSSTTSSLITIASSAPNIAIASAKVNSASTILVTFVNPVENLASVDSTKWHIDVGNGGLTPLNPTSAAVTSAGTPWTITLTFSGTPFSNTAAAYAAAVGLYADASAVTDTNGDTNVVVGHAASIAIADGQAPTIVSISPANTSGSNDRMNPIIITFSEPMDAISFIFSTIPAVSYTPTWISTSVVSLAHNTFNSNQLYTITISVANDAATVPNSMASLPFHSTFTTTQGSFNLTNTLPVAVSNISVQINGGATTTTSGNVVLAIAAINAALMKISNNPFFTDSAWENYATTKNWTLSSGNGPKTVYAKFISTGGIETDLISTNITVNAVPATSTTTITATVTPAVPATPAVPKIETEGCKKGFLFSSTTGQACVFTSTTPAVPATPSTVTGTITTTTTNTAGVTTVRTYNFGTALLRNGSKGESVKELQRFLNKVLKLSLKEDGILGSKTVAIIKKWQKDNGLKDDGLVGEKTKEKMNKSVQE